MQDRADTRPKRVLVFCLPGIGDTLFFIPALRLLRRECRDAHITALTMFPSTKELLEADTLVDEVINFDFPNKSAFSALRFVLGLRSRRFDTTILSYPSNRFEYNVIPLLLGAKRRAGHRYNNLDRLCANWLNTVSVREDDALSNVEENLRLVDALLGTRSTDTKLTLKPGEKHEAFAKSWFWDRKLDGRTVIGFHAGGSWRKNHVNKRWRPEQFSELGRILVKKLDARIVVFGGQDEDELKAAIAESISSETKVEAGSHLMDTCAVIKRCDYFVSNDSALLHLASALGVPSTGVFGPTNRDWVTLPSFPRNDISLGLHCQPCFYYSPRHLRCKYGDYRCIRDLTPKMVGEHVLHQLRKHQEAVREPVTK